MYVDFNLKVKILAKVFFTEINICSSAKENQGTNTKRSRSRSIKNCMKMYQYTYCKGRVGWKKIEISE